MPTPAQAAPSNAKLEMQIQELESEIAELKAERTAPVAVVQQQQQQQQSEIDEIVANQVTVSKKLTAVAPPKGGNLVSYDKKKGFKVGGLTLKIGGFVAAETALRDKNETGDIGSSFSSSVVPFRNSANYHQSELRATGRQSRLSIMISGAPDRNTSIKGYYEGDFLGAAVSANSKESNSYTPRIRQVWASYERSDLGLHVFAGQTWTLATLEKKGMLPLDEMTPLTIDASYVPGFSYLRNPELRFVKDWDKKYWLGLALDNPQTIIGGTAPATVENATNFGNGFGLQGSSLISYSNNIAPDITLKGAADTAFGHYEVFGITRFFEDRTTYPTATAHQNDVVVGGGIGAAALVPVIPKKLDLQLSGMWGEGTGRYGSTQLPDVTYEPDGSFKPIINIQALFGVIGHVTSMLDVYGYAGVEQDQSTGTGGTNGYGSGVSGATTASGCLVEGGACTINFHRIEQGTVGDWWKIYSGPAGTMQWGLQYSATRFDAFRGAGITSTINPHTIENQVYASLRYYPFQ
jgi:hypothetical protein